ncbi:t-SNARE VTI1 [Microbotryomycetes sp. JL221]|nr:t-SNARE VTI1 [Microbotryomycetes sp. JL221]
MTTSSPLMHDSVFGEYETDLSTLVSTISNQLTKTRLKQVRGDDRRTLLRRVERELEEADEIIAQMDIEVQTCDKQERHAMQSQLNKHKSTLNTHKTEWTKLSSSTDRDDLLDSTTSSNDVTIEMLHQNQNDDMDENQDQRQTQRNQLLSQTNQLSLGQQRLQQSHKVALETEMLGSDILTNLRGQRDQLQHTRDTLYEADGSIDRASGTLKRMMRTAQQQRLVTYGIIAILIFLILYVLYSKVLG